MAMRWEQATDAALIELWQQGLSVDGIAERIDRTVSAVTSRACKLRLHRQPGDRSRYAPVMADGKVYWTEKDDAALRELMTRGVGLGDAAIELGRTEQATKTRWRRISNQGSPRVFVSTSAKTRKCMRCGGVFNSEHRGNRLCAPCGHYAVSTRSQYD